MVTTHALHIHEIVLAITEQVYAEPVRRTRRDGLARLARVGRIFYEPAVRLLWSEMPDIEPLFRLLSNCVPTPDAPAGPADDDEDSEGVQSTYSLTLNGPALDNEITRLQEYALRVRVLDFPRAREEHSWTRPLRRTPRGITLDPHSLENLLLRTGRPLFPNLVKLTLPVTPPYRSDPTFLICPSLRELTISFPETRLFNVNTGIGMLFEGIFSQLPRVTHLRVQSECYAYHDTKDANFRPWMRHDDDWFLDVTPPVAGISTSTPSHVFCDALAAVSMLNDLEVFSIITMNTGVVGRDLITALSALPKLRECSLAVDVAPDVLRTVRPGFSSLRVLSVSNVLLGTELNVFDSPHLQDLTLYHCDWTTPEIYRRTFETVAQRFLNLRRLYWKLGRKRVNFMAAAPPTVHILAIALQPLCTLHALQELYINMRSRPVYDDDIALLVQGAPCLQHLELKFDTENDGPSAQSLLTLAQGCPSLQTLRLSSLSITEADEGNIDSYPCVGNPLRWLSIAVLRCKGAIHAAMIIDLLFPFLDIRECRLRVPKDSRYNGQFAGVLDRLEAYHAERE